MKWEKSDEGTLECTSGASLEGWQVKSLLDGASKDSLSRYLLSEGWSEEETEGFCEWVNDNGGFQYK